MIEKLLKKRQVARSPSLNFIQKTQAQNCEWEMLVKVWAGVAVPSRFSSVASLEEWSWVRRLFFNMPLVWEVSSLFRIAYLSPSPQYPFLPHSVYFPLPPLFFNLPCFVISELEMESVSAVQVIGRSTQSHTWLPCDLQGQPWNCMCVDAVPVLNSDLVKLLAGVCS